MLEFVGAFARPPPPPPPIRSCRFVSVEGVSEGVGLNLRKAVHECRIPSWHLYTFIYVVVVGD